MLAKQNKPTKQKTQTTNQKKKKSAVKVHSIRAKTWYLHEDFLCTVLLEFGFLEHNTELPYQMFRASSVPCKCLTSSGMFWLIFFFFF